MSDDPKDVRMIHTRDGVARVPRSQEGVPLKDYLQNTELPEDLERAVIYATPSGPVAAMPDPVPWSQDHETRVQGYAEAIKEQIDDKGYYAKTLENYANRLSNETGYPPEEMKAMIVSRFDQAYGQEPFDHLQSVRADKGLPVREKSQDQQDQTSSFEPEQ